jgi:hypothetical protein
MSIILNAAKELAKETELEAGALGLVWNGKEWIKSHPDPAGPKGELGENGTDPSPFDPVQKPDYYNKGKIECIDAIEVAIADLTGIEAKCTGDAIKYLWRWKAKENPVQDLKKAIWYIEHLIKKIENER